MKLIHLAVYDTLADWETGYAVAGINNPQFQRESGRYAVRTVGETLDSVTTMGGVRIQPDVALADLRPLDSAMLILPGAHDVPAAFARSARTFLDAGTPVAAICGATAALASEGLLDDREHTSNAPEFLAMTGYAGGDRYRDAPAVTDGELITASGVRPLEFTREVFAKLDLYAPEVLEAWYGLYSTGDPRHFHARGS